MLDERTERLINRRLDGEITEQESLELDKQLIRCPEARVHLEEMQRLDLLAGRSLRAALTTDEAKSSAAAGPDAWPARTGLWRRYLRPIIAVAAAAAALAFLVVTYSSDQSPTDITPPTVADNGAAVPATSLMPQVTGVGGTGWPVGETHEVIGVVDEETQSVYLLEMNRPNDAAVRTVMRY